VFVIKLDALRCEKPPVLEGLTAGFLAGELPAVCGADAAERAALVELLAGFRSESAGTFVAFGQPMPPRARRNAVVVLPQRAALTEDLSAGEHLRLVSRLRGKSAEPAVLKQLLTFAGIDRAGRRPHELSGEAQLRLTLGLAMVGRPKLALALDPPAEVAAIMSELMAPDRSLVVVAESLLGLESRVTRALALENGRLTSDMTAAVADPETRIFSVSLLRGSAALELLLAKQAGVNVDRLAQGKYRLHVARAVALAPLIRALLAAGVVLESVTALGEGPARR
jgi:ABC-type multidrug transport system ATPase subunit